MTQAGNKKAGQGIRIEAGASLKTRAVRMLGAQGTGGSSFTGFVTRNISVPPPVSPPAAPANLWVEWILGEYSSLRLIWTDQSTDETGFQIERKTGAGGTYAQIGTAAANATTYMDTGLLEATQYFYRIRAVNDAGNSVYSNEVGAMTYRADGGGSSVFSGSGGCSISPEGKSKGEFPLGTMLALLSPGIFLVVRKTFHRK